MSSFDRLRAVLTAETISAHLAEHKASMCRIAAAFEDCETDQQPLSQGMSAADARVAEEANDCASAPSEPRYHRTPCRCFPEAGGCWQHDRQDAFPKVTDLCSKCNLAAGAHGDFGFRDHVFVDASGIAWDVDWSRYTTPPPSFYAALLALVRRWEARYLELYRKNELDKADERERSIDELRAVIEKEQS